jgi:glutamate-1-semialdehyde 2,1-aminomutase
MTAGIETLSALGDPQVYDALERHSARLTEGIAEAARVAGVATFGTRVGSMFTLFFTDQPVVDYTSAKRSNPRRYAAFFNALLERGVYLAPSQFEAGFLSLAHSDLDVEQTIAAASAALKVARETP